MVRQHGQGYGEYLLCGQAAGVGIWLVSSLWSGSRGSDMVSIFSVVRGRDMVSIFSVARGRDMVSIFSVVRQQGQGYG